MDSTSNLSIKNIEPWMFRTSGEYLALLFSISLLIILGIIFSTFNLGFFFLLLLMGLLYVKLLQAQYMGNAMRVHASQYPEIFELFKKHAITLNIPKASLYIKQDPMLNAYSLGLNTCTVILTSSLVEQFSSDEISFTIGHELGHYKAGHTKISSFINPLGSGNIFSSLIFGFWQRKTEYTADRCGLVVTKNIDAALTSFIKLAVGGKLAKELNIQGYLSQIKNANTPTIKLSELLGDHPLITNRVKNLILFWKESFKTNEV